MGSSEGVRGGQSFGNNFLMNVMTRCMYIMLNKLLNNALKRLIRLYLKNTVGGRQFFWQQFPNQHYDNKTRCVTVII